ncbi:hypothetical protein EC9_19540 [Rosistilla ulvae]|uniref:DUF5009 domain-containing protein n=1 Tax=Rosistilla ulvae TaxID=1930277 RepID=A0A517LYS6_9BACT|nr:DUF5009 domain-containing protein [Rosistilla ulvae]QDS87772.1 hypothetical protein EC9_19540 [Rosistilla ulvae]
MSSTVKNASSESLMSRLPGSQPPKMSAAPVAAASSRRLVSLDAYRGFIMLLLAANGFGIARLASLPESAPIWNILDRGIWTNIGWYFHHPEWISQFHRYGVSPWDLIQPAFMFMVGVAMPFSFARRESSGQSDFSRHMHALIRAVVLILLGVFLQSASRDATNWTFVNVLSQIGLGYFFVYLMLPLRWGWQVVAIGLILIGYGLFFKVYDLPANYDFNAVAATPETVFEGTWKPWSKNANIAHQVDLRLLNALPRDEEFLRNQGGYVTLNFIPSMATMLLGVLCGRLLIEPTSPWRKFGILLLMAAVTYGLGIAAGETICPIVKRIWTPSWTLFSGGYVIAMLALFYLLFDLLPLRKLAFPLVVIGVNSLLMYMMGQLIRGWTAGRVEAHFGGLIERVLPGAFDSQMWGALVAPISAMIVFWLIAYWLYRQRIFLRV